MNTLNNTQSSSQSNEHRLIEEPRLKDIWERINRIAQDDGELDVQIGATWQGDVRWGRNHVTASRDSRALTVFVRKATDTGKAAVITNQVDDASLESAVRAVERKIKYGRSSKSSYDGIAWFPPRLPYPETSIWSNATFDVTSQQRNELAGAICQQSKGTGFLSAGFLQMFVAEVSSYRRSNIDQSVLSPADDDNVIGSGSERMARERVYIRHTESQCSMTVRHPKGISSGWAGQSSYDWSSIDAQAIADQAFFKCKNSLNPISIEPGRYTVILEPQATSALCDILIRALQDRFGNEVRPGPFYLGKDSALGIQRSKLGIKVIDERISVSHDPMDNQLGVLPDIGLRPVTWINRGVLTTLGYRRDYALEALNENLPALGRMSYRVSGGGTTIEEMISSTERGILVSRLYGVEVLDNVSLLASGVTRDGLWLIEDGKISKSLKNMRWTDSPLFTLNQIEQLGHPVPVFRPGSRYRQLIPAVVPPLKAKDFAFVASMDAI